MSEKNDFEIPSPSEKLSYKFILDAIKSDKVIQVVGEETLETVPETESVVEEVAGPTEEGNCGRETEVPETPEMPMEPVTEGTEIELEMAPELPFLPDGKKYFRIGEVSELIGVEPYVLRYWEGEFASMVRPIKSKTGQRVYARKDVETLAQIRHLLHVEKFSIKGAKKRLLENRKQNQPKANPAVLRREESLKRLVTELKELVALAKNDPGM